MSLQRQHSLNDSLKPKVDLRQQAIAACDDDPTILESCGGEGIIYLNCYSRFQGWVFDRDDDMIPYLAEQRPGWSVIRGGAEKILASAPTHYDADFYDIDPTGSPWEIYESLFTPGRFTKPRFQLVAHDGCRHFLSMNAGGTNDHRWKHGLLLEIAKEQGDSIEKLYYDYAAIAQTKLYELGENCGYRMTRWESFYTGDNQRSTHYWASFQSNLL